MRLRAPRFSLRQTLHSGQLFRFEETAGGFLVSHRDKAFLVRQERDALLVAARTPNVTAAWLRRFFALDERPPVPVDAFSRKALASCGGVRVCRQDPWECVVGFLCSQNNNGARIRQLMDGLAERFGTPVSLAGHATYLFPEPGAIRPGPALDAVRAGYRARYLAAASASLTDGWLDSLHALPTPQVREALLALPGVGPKVADCILLFAYGRREAFPIDTWIAKVMREEYGAVTTAQMRALATERFGADAGVLQQYFFHYRRSLA